MKTPNWLESHDRLWLAVLIVALAGLAPLAWLQYRWVDQVAEAERARMRVHLDTAVARFAQDFDGEWMRLFRALQAIPPGPPERELEDLAAHWLEFGESGGTVRAVRDFYVTLDGRDGRESLYRFEAAQGAFAPVQWLPELERALPRPPFSEFGPPRMFNPVLERIPALAIPRRGMSRPDAEPRPRGRRRRPERSRWCVLVLDLDYLQRVVLPELTGRHLRQSGELSYEVRVVSRADPRRVIYTSDAALPPGFFDAPDARAELLRLRPAAPRPEFEGPGGAWLLLARHRGRSLEAVAAAARRRNLAVSLTVLLVLAGGIAVLLVTTRRAQRLARQQMEFVAGVSHELRTPLAVICSAADNLADGLVTGERQVTRYGGVIRGEGRRLAHMVEQILGFAGLQSGRVKYDLQPVEVASVIEKALAACAPEMRAGGCGVERDIAPDLPPAMADATALAHGLRNLVDNALLHGGRGGWVGIRARRDGAGSIEIRVEDRGPGIDPADLPHIFEPFYRGRRSKREQVKGFGLGLALVQRIVEAHAGAIEVSGGPGQGTIFTLRIPAAPEDSPDG
ncbi:MAG: HAMP domain-containing histidine kinase [Acidobacteria bacterium]|nr:HAMP domain-containing histidine kinase [Acidobacteriota bacterium]